MRVALLLSFATACGSAGRPAAAPPAPGAPTAARPPTLRLPATVKPTRGDLDLTVDPAQPTFTGVAAYEVTLAEPTAVVWLNATGLTLTAASAEVGGASRPGRIVPGNDDAVGLAFEPPLPAGAARLSVRYGGPLDAERSVGLYRVAENPGEWYAFTFFEPIDARRAFPCFDEPAAKHPWRITLRVPRGQVALANSAVSGETDDGAGRTKVTFEETRPLPSYLVAFIVGPFELVDGGLAGHHGTPLRFAIPRGRAAELRYARTFMPRIVGLLEDYFGMPYPYGKLDVAVTPRFWGTMEHPGLVALGQPLMLIKPDEETVERRRFAAWISIHELAHYWFGDYVTAAWWDDIWLNEALGSWIDRKITDALEPAWKVQVENVASTSAAMRVDVLASAKKIRQPVASKDDIANAFDAQITYSKGAAVLRMFELWLGEERWRAFIRGFLDRHAWGNATADDFLAALGAAAGPEAPAGMRTFLDQPGVPLVTVRKACEAGAPPRLALAQTAFVPPGVRASGERRWTFPVCARWADGRACTLLDGATGTLVLDGAKGCPAWVLPNADGAGYYRVAHDPATLEGLLRAPLTLLERVTLAAEIADLAAAGQIPIAAALSQVPRLARHGSRHLLESSVALVGVVRRDLLDEGARAALARFVRKAYAAPLRQAGVLPRRGDDDDARLRRSALLGVLGNAGADPAVWRDAARLARRWLDDRSSVPADVAPLLLDLAAQHGDRALFDRVLAEAGEVSDRREQEELYTALGAFPGAELGSAALALVASRDIDVRSSIGILKRRLWLGDAPADREQAWRWLVAHWDELTPRMRADEQMSLFDAGAVFCDAAHRAEVASALGARANAVEGGPRALANALETIDVCVAQQELNAAGIREFLARI